MKKFALPVLSIAFCIAGLSVASAQTTTPNQNPNTPLNSKGDGIENARRDSVDNARLQESTQDKSVIRQQQRGMPDSNRGVVNPTTRDNTTLDNVPQSSLPQQATPSNTMPNGTQNPANRPMKTTTTQNNQTTTTHQTTQEKAQIGRQAGNGDVNAPAKTNQITTTTQTTTHTNVNAPDRTMIKTRTVTVNGKTIEKEYYNEYEVLRDQDRRYYLLDSKRIYFNDGDMHNDNGNHGEMNNGNHNGDKHHDHIDNGNHNGTNDGMHTTPQKNPTTTPK